MAGIVNSQYSTQIASSDITPSPWGAMFSQCEDVTPMPAEGNDTKECNARDVRARHCVHLRTSDHCGRRPQAALRPNSQEHKVLSSYMFVWIAYGVPSNSDYLYLRRMSQNNDSPKEFLVFWTLGPGISPTSPGRK